MLNPERFRLRRALTAASLVLSAAGLLLAAACGSSSGGSAPSGERAANAPGKFVWHDLTTNDLASSKKFYASLFGWEYAETTILGQPYSVARLGKTPVAGIHSPKNDAGGKTPAHWLSYMSVADVDASVAKAKDSGAAVLAGPTDVGTVGRAAVLKDPQGAPFGLLRLTAGDPADLAAPVVGTIFWNEYLTHDLQAAFTFYNGLVPFELTASKSEGDTGYAVLKHGKARAGVFDLPESRKDVRPNWLPYVLVTDPAALAVRVTGLGGRVLLQPSPEHRNGSLAIVADPDGAVIALQKYPF